MKAILFYSGGCRFCRAVARALVKLDVFKQLVIIPTRSVLADPFLGHLPNIIRHGTWWVLPVEGGLVPGNDGGIIALLKALYWPRPLAAICVSCRLNAFLNLLDDFVKDHRWILSGLVRDGHAPVVIDRSTYSLSQIAQREKEAA